jgi:hypothetical protein
MRFFSQDREMQEKFKIRRKIREKIKMKQGLESLHWVGGADGLPEDGVRPANLVAEPPQRVPHRHLPRKPDARKEVRQTLAPLLQGPPPPAPPRGTRDGTGRTSKTGTASLGAAAKAAGAPGLLRAEPAGPRRPNASSPRRRRTGGHQPGPLRASQRQRRRFTGKRGRGRSGVGGSSRRQPAYLPACLWIGVRGDWICRCRRRSAAAC